MIKLSKKDALRSTNRGASLFISIQLTYEDAKETYVMVRTRTIKEAAAYFREGDPQTCLTETAIRTLLRSGAVPSVKVGKKYLVSLEALESYLMGEIEPPAQIFSSQSSQPKVWQIH